VIDLARAHGAAIVPLPGRWYGIDPIHIRRGAWREAWPEILAPWTDASAADSTAAPWSPRRWIQLRTLVPEAATVLGVRVGAVQPGRRLSDGTTVSLY
jgi:hypothetical protein